MENEFQLLQRAIGIALDYANAMVDNYNDETRDDLETIVTRLHRSYFLASKLKIEQGEK